jgi:hypothetical protein
VSCKNHPNANVIANCFDCGTPMCRLCATFFGEEALCMRCIHERQAKQPAIERSRKGLSRAARRQMITNGALKQKPKLEIRSLFQRWRWLFYALLLAVVYVRLLVYTNPNLFNVDEEALAQLRAADDLEACRLVFEEIGIQLEENQMPDANLRCDESYVPNFITREGSSIRVSHPNPDYHGLSEIYVTSRSHEPVFVE